MVTVRVHVAEPLDLVCWRHYGRRSAGPQQPARGIVEAVLAANPELRHYGVLLPVGLMLRMPDIPVTPARLPVLQKLWD